MVADLRRRGARHRLPGAPLRRPRTTRSRAPRPALRVAGALVPAGGRSHREHPRPRKCRYAAGRDRAQAPRRIDAQAAPRGAGRRDRPRPPTPPTSTRPSAPPAPCAARPRSRASTPTTRSTCRCPLTLDADEAVSAPASTSKAEVDVPARDAYIDLGEAGSSSRRSRGVPARRLRHALPHRRRAPQGGRRGGRRRGDHPPEALRRGARQRQVRPRPRLLRDPLRAGGQVQGAHVQPAARGLQARRHGGDARADLRLQRHRRPPRRGARVPRGPGDRPGGAGRRPRAAAPARSAAPCTAPPSSPGACRWWSATRTRGRATTSSSSAGSIGDGGVPDHQLPLQRTASSTPIVLHETVAGGMVRAEILGQPSASSP